MRYEVTVDVAAEAARVWATLADVEHWPDWTPTFTEIRALDGPLRVGSRYRAKQPGSLPAVWRITECEPDRSFNWESRLLGSRLTATHLAEPAADGTRVTLSFAITGGPARLLELLAGKRIRRYVETEANSLQRRCEDSPQ